MNNIKSNPWWIFWGIFVALVSLLFYNLFGFNPTTLVKKQEDGTLSSDKQDQINLKFDDVDTGPVSLSIDPVQMIHFTQKTVCRRNIQYINTMVELWYIRHDGVWPQDDLSDIGRDTDYFPNGLPSCPVDGSPYKLDPISFRIVGHDHSDISSPLEEAGPRKNSGKTNHER